VAERPVALPPEKEWERHMPRFGFSHAQQTIRAAAESRQEGAYFMRCARAEFAETRAATLKTIAESRELMAKRRELIAKIDAVMAKR
jgi:hypothetical protein